jgi:hypothetical protein
MSGNRIEKGEIGKKRRKTGKKRRFFKVFAEET